MATLLRGKRKGETVALHQWANDWFSLQDGSIVSPLSIRLDAEETRRVVASPAGLDHFYELNSNGTFKKRRS